MKLILQLHRAHKVIEGDDQHQESSDMCRKITYFVNICDIHCQNFYIPCCKEIVK